MTERNGWLASGLVAKPPRPDLHDSATGARRTGRVFEPDANRLSDAGIAYLKRLVPEKYKVGRPFV